MSQDAMANPGLSYSSWKRINWKRKKKILESTAESNTLRTLKQMRIQKDKGIRGKSQPKAGRLFAFLKQLTCHPHVKETTRHSKSRFIFFNLWDLGLHHFFLVKQNETLNCITFLIKVGIKITKQPKTPPHCPPHWYPCFTWYFESQKLTAQRRKDMCRNCWKTPSLGPLNAWTAWLYYVSSSQTTGPVIASNSD